MSEVRPDGCACCIEARAALGKPVMAEPRTIPVMSGTIYHLWSKDSGHRFCRGIVGQQVGIGVKPPKLVDLLHDTLADLPEGVEVEVLVRVTGRVFPRPPFEHADSGPPAPGTYKDPTWHL